MTARRSPLGLRLLCFALTWVPPLVLLFAAGRTAVTRLNAVLAQAAPLVAAEASRALGREVRIGDLSPDLSVTDIVRMALSPSRLGTFSVTLEDVAIANDRTLAESGTLATAQRVTAFISVPHLLAGDLSAALQRLRVESPELLLVRTTKGRFNIQDLIRPRQGPPGKLLRTVVVIRNGRLTFRDFAADLPPARLPATNWLHEINGVVNLSGLRTVRFEAAGRPMPGTPTARRLGGPIAVQGSLARGAAGPTGARALVSLDVEDADAAYWVNYLLDTDAFHVTAGRVDADVAVVWPPPVPSVPGTPAPQAQYTGVVKIRGGRVTGEALPAPLESIAGGAQFDLGSVRFDATGSLFGEKILAEGVLWNWLRPAGPGPSLRVAVKMPRVPVGRAVDALLPEGQRLPPGVSVGGIASLAAQARGSLREPIITAEVAIPTVVYRGLRAENVRAGLAYADGVVSVLDLSGRAIGGTLTGQATARIAAEAPRGNLRLLPPSEITAAFEGAIGDVELSRIPVARWYAPLTRLAGSATLEVVGKVVNGEVTAAANVLVPQAVVNDIVVRALRARVLVEDNRIVIPSLVARTSAGAVRISGDVTPGGRLDLDLDAVAVDLGRVARVFGQEQVRGLAYVEGAITGTVRDPVLKADVRVLNPGYHSYRADIATGDITATRSQVTLKDVVARRFPAAATLSGTVTNLQGRAPRLNLTARVQNVELTEILRQAGQEPSGLPQIAGILDQATLRLTGTTINPRLVGSGQVENVIVGDRTIGKGAFDFRYTGGATSVTRAELQTGVGTLTASGRMGPEGGLSGEFRAEEVNLEPLTALTRRLASLGGKVTITGTLSGTRTRPVVEATLASDRIAVAGIPLQNLSGRLNLVANTDTDNVRVTVPGLSFQQNGTEVNIDRASYDQNSGSINLDLSLETGDIAALLDALRRSGLADTEVGARLLAALDKLPQPIEGKLSVPSLVVQGRLTPKGLEHRQVRAALSAENVRIGQARADSLQVAGALVGDLLRLEEFTLKNDATDTTIIARGTADLNGQIDAVLESNNASLALLRTFAPGLRLDGRVDLTVTAQGQTRTPTVTASLQGRDVTVGGITLDLLRVPSVVLHPVEGGAMRGKIDINEVFLLGDGQRARIAGELPFSYADFSVPADRPIDLQASVNQQSLDLIAALVPAIKEQWLSGTFTAQLDVEGTLRNPELSGFIRVTDGQLSPPKDAFPETRINSIKDLDLYISFESSTAKVRTFQLALGGPGGADGDYGRITLSGQIDLGNLQALSSLLRTGAQPGRAGALDLVVSLNQARLVAENLLNLGAAARGRVNGDLTITGPLERPVIATRRGAPLVVADAQFRTPTRQASEGLGQRTYPVNPRFDVAVAIDRRAVITSENTFRIEADGTAAIEGTLADPDIRGNLEVLGGFFRLPTARFAIQRGGEIDLAFRPPDAPLFRVSDLVARATVYAPSGTTPSLGVRASQGLFASTARSSTGRSTRYRITARIDGSLIKTLPGGEFELRLDPQDLDLSSDPSLDEKQIIALIGSQRQIATAIGGDVRGALTQTFTQVLNSDLIPTFLSPLERTIASVFGFEEFGLEYNPGAPLTLRFVRRFPDPFDRFLISYATSLPTAAEPGVPDPYVLRLFYELTPRLDIGVSVDEQEEVIYFLRGSISF